MNNQNILNNIATKSGVSLDSSEQYDVILEDSIKIDCYLDFSQFFDFELESATRLELKLDSSEFYDFTLYLGDVNYTEEMLILIDDYLLTEKLEPLLSEDGYNIIY